jgi:hypothetical protein
MTLEDEAYFRGKTEGRIEARLDGHDKQLAAINGSVTRTAEALSELASQVQRLGDQAIAREATVITTAKALKDAQDAQRDKTEQTWLTPLRLITIMASLATVAGTAIGLLALFH